MLPNADEHAMRELQPVETVEMCRGQCGALASACRNKDFAAARALIEQGVDIAELDSDNFNAAIHWAAWNGSHSLVTDLLRARACIHQANQEGLQAVHLATRNGRLSTLAALWRHEQGVVAARDSEGGTAAHHAANCGFIHILEWLYLKGASMKSADSYGLTPLHCAVMAGKVLATQMLLRRGADALAVDVKRRTPLHWAAVHGRGALVESVYGIDRGDLGGLAAFDTQDYQGKRPQDLTRLMDICMTAHLAHAKAWHGRANTGCFLRCLTKLMPRQPTTLFMVFLTPCLHSSCSAVLNAMSRRKPRLCAIAVSSLPFLGLTRLFVTKLPWTQKDVQYRLLPAVPLPVVEATLQDWHSGHAVGLAHRAVAQDVVEDVVEVVEELESCLSRSDFGVKLQPRAAPPVDLKKTPWEALDATFQAEGKRCWGPGFDGKVPGYIAECLRRDNPASSDEPPFRRRWLKRREEESDEAPDPYATLGVDPNATLKEIRKAMLGLSVDKPRRTAMQQQCSSNAACEPWTFPGDAVAFQDILLAYRILSDEERRKEYDQTGEDGGDAPAEERKVRVSDLATLRSAVENHREVRWERGMANLAGQTGTVQFDDPDTGLTEVVIWISEEDGFSAWLPSDVLTYLNPDGEEQPYEFYQQALMRLNKGAIVKIEPYEKQMSRIVEYTLGWQSHDSGAMQKPDPLRDAAFAQVFFKKGREAEDRGVVLDIGCGTGDGSRLFATSRKFDLVFGLDKNSTALDQARQESEDEEIGPEQGLFLLRGDAQELPCGGHSAGRRHLQNIEGYINLSAAIPSFSELCGEAPLKRSSPQLTWRMRNVSFELFSLALYLGERTSVPPLPVVRCCLQFAGQVISFRLFWKTCWSDPGYCAAHVHNTDADEPKIDAKSYPNEYLQLASSQEAELDPAGWGKKACVVCGRLRTRRCKHCRQCGRCVARFDHHCPWLGNCVGEGNLNVFLRFLASTLLRQLQSLLLAIGLAFEGLEAASLVLRGAELPLWYTAVSILMVIDCFLVLFVGCVFTRQVLLAAADLTEYEDSVEDGLHLCTILRRTSVRILLANSLKWFLPAFSKDAGQDTKDPDLEAQLSQRGTDTAEKQEPQTARQWCFLTDIESVAQAHGNMRKGQWTAPAPAVYGKGRPAKIPVGGGPLIPPAGYKGAAPAAFSNKQSQNWQQQQQQQSWQGQGQKEDTGPPRVLNLQLFQESQLTTQGFPPEAPAIVYDKSMHVFSSAHSILQEIVGDISVEVEIHHDTEWDIFPEIGESIRHAGGEELCFSVGTCPNQGRWAVGIANGWKGRETAVKLALGFSLLADRSPDELENFCKNYPEFRVMVAEAGLLPSRGPPKRSAFNASQGQQWQSSPKQNSWSAPPAPAGGGFPKFVWASLDNTAGLVQEGLPAEGLCVYHDKQFADLFRNGQYVLQEDMSGSGSKTGQRGPLQIPEDDDILWRSSTWSGETQIKPQLPEEIPCPLYTDAKCYGGRFTYAQWRKFFAQERKKGMQQDASGQIIEVGRSQDFSWNAFIQFFRPEIWLLVLLHADAAALRAIASCCRGFQQITVPWRRRGTSSSGAELEKPEMPVVQLAARLRCGLPLAEELLHLPNQIQLPSTCRSWLDLLHQQEIEGAWLCLVHAGGMRDDVEEEVQVVEDFCQAVAVAEQWSEKVPRPQHVVIALLPSARQHSTAEQSVCIRKAVKIIGLPLPVLTGAGEIELRSRWQAPEPPGHWRAYLPMLSLRHVEVALDATTACICYMGGQLTVEDGCTLQDCEVGISVCDQGSIVFIEGKLRIACRDGGRNFEQVSRGIVTTAKNFQRI
eukprot:s327_g13.t4